jgi:hypothetical protein
MKRLAILLLLLVPFAAFGQSSNVIGAGELGTDSVDSDEIAASAVGTSEIDDNTVAAADIAPNAVLSSEFGIPTFEQVYCGQLDENGTIYFGAGNEFAVGATVHTPGSTACDALDNATEATADAALLPLDLKIYGMVCLTLGTLGSGETLVYSARSAEADLADDLTCTIAEGETYCSDLGSSTTVTGGATVAIQAVQTSNNADDDGWCKIVFGPAGTGGG